MAPVKDFSTIADTLRDKTVDVCTRDTQYQGVALGMAGMGLLVRVDRVRCGFEGAFVTNGYPRTILITWHAIETVEVMS